MAMNTRLQKLYARQAEVESVGYRNELEKARRSLDKARLKLARIKEAITAQKRKIEETSAKWAKLEAPTRTELYGLLACSIQQDGKLVFVDRDRNASKNLWHLGRLYLDHDGKRPKAFSR